MRRLALSMLPLLSLLSPAPLLADSDTLSARPVFVVGNRYHFIRVTEDLVSGAQKNGTIVWEALEPVPGYPRFRIVETKEGKANEIIWRYDHINNPIAQELGNGCELLNEPDGGRYRWPIEEGTTWNARFEVVERCADEAEVKTLASCDVYAKVIALGDYNGLGEPFPAAAIERVVPCTQPANPGHVSIRYEKELICLTIGMRCAFEADTVMLSPEEATEEALAAYRSQPDQQRFTNRISDKLKRLELKPAPTE